LNNPEEPKFQAPTEAAPVDLADVFRRVGAKVDLEEKHRRAAVLESRIERPLDTGTPRRQYPLRSQKPMGRDEESVDSNMSR